MPTLRIEGGVRLLGEHAVSSSKNAVLPILAASILTDDPVVLTNAPDIVDVLSMREILHTLGAQSDKRGADLWIDASCLHAAALPDTLAKKLRSSIFLLGPMLARLGIARVTHPGGCDIGLRPIDLHLHGLKSLGVTIHERGGEIFCDGAHMHAGPVHLDYPSVGATENVMMLASLLPGETVLYNAAREPEIIDLAGFLTAMGACISGAGTSTIVVHGARKLHGCRYRPIPDRIVAGTLLCALAITGGEGAVTGIAPSDLTATLAKLSEMGCTLHETKDRIHLKAPARLLPFDHLQTSPHPGFPTDLQAPMLSLSTVANGTSVITENIFENRFTHVPDFVRMGADIRVAGRTAIVRGVSTLSGARVTAGDLRGGAALVLMGLKAEGTTYVAQAELIDRGYEQLEAMLMHLGAKVFREP